jgi:hypothetical protein
MSGQGRVPAQRVPPPGLIVHGMNARAVWRALPRTGWPAATTMQVAEALGVDTRRARIILEGLAEEGFARCLRREGRRALEWRRQ